MRNDYRNINIVEESIKMGLICSILGISLMIAVIASVIF